MGFAASLMHTTPRQANANGASTPSLVPASRDMKLGKATRGKSEARPRGSRGLTIPRPILFFGPPAILRLRIAARGARATISTVIRSEEHTSELQSLTNLVCRLLLAK